MAHAPRTIDVAKLIEERKLSPFNYKLIIISWLITAFDGFDQMMISYTAPYIRDQYSLNTADIGWLVSWGTAGMMVGGFLFSWLADQIGRRPTVIFAAFTFGILTMATGLAQTLTQFAILRFLDGLAIGGMLPLAWALNIEFVPKRMRSTVVTVIMMGYSVGTASAGPLTNLIAPIYGWQGVYFAGGAGTLVAAALLLLYLPESARFLVTRGLGSDRVASILNRVDPALGVTPADTFILGDEAKAGGRFHVRQLFEGDLARITPPLWIGYIASSFAIYFGSSFGPMIIEALDFPRKTAALVTSLSGIMGAVGGLLLMRFTDRLGPRVVAFYPALAVPILLIIGFGFVPHEWFLVVQVISILMLSGGHFGMHSIAGIFYPSAIRASGAGWATSVAKVGSVLGPLIGGYVLASGIPVIRTYALLAICPAILCISMLALGAVVRGRSVRELPEGAAATS
jgi:AAHS family 4-hydroxybenzoate transporter-like MFS transporter